jgi:hypothetical protein
MNCKALDPRKLKSGDVIEHKAVIVDGVITCRDCGKVWRKG